MKVLTVNFSDVEGGAARAATRLHKSLVKEGVDAKMLVLNKFGTDINTVGPSSLFSKMTAKMQSVLNPLPLRKFEYSQPFSPSYALSVGIVKKINDHKADIVHLHWINAGMLRIEDLNKINAPLVWSLHDMWAFTGGCHYSGGCESYLLSCGKCPILNSKIENDLSKKLFIRKSNVYSKLTNLTVVGLSKWLAQCAKKSELFKDKAIVNLPNPIDTEMFRPLDKEAARKTFNLPNDKKLILFGSMSATSDIRKGFNELREALKILQRPSIGLVVFGNDLPKEDILYGFQAYYLGNINDDHRLNQLYNAADVMVVPSIEENLSNAIMESLSCGTPVVGFDIGGNGDMITHKKDGYLAKERDVKDLSQGIDWVLNHPDAKGLSKNARNKVLANFESRLVSKKYVEMYKTILNH